MSAVRRAITYSLLSSNVVMLLQLIGSMIIARLLLPEQIGMFSVALVLMGLAQIFRDMGVTDYIIQVEHLTNGILRTAFGLMLLIAIGIALAIGLASTAIASFYGEPGMREIMLVLALNFAITPLGSLTLACVRREMRFRAIAALDLASTTVALGTSIILAYQGYGAISLAWGAVAGTLTSFLGSLMIRPAYLPWSPSLRGLKPMLGFGAVTSLSAFLGYLNKNGADVVLGKVADMSAVAFFNKARALNLLLGNLLTRGLDPVLSALSMIRRQGGDLRQTLLNGTLLLTGITWPVYAVIAVLAEPLILVMFGDQWHASIPLVPYVALGALLSSTYTLCGAAYSARGRPSLNLATEAINLPIQFGAIIILAPYGLPAVAQAWPFIALAGIVVQQFLLRRELGITPVEVYRPLWKNAALAVTCALAAYLAQAWAKSIDLPFAPFSILVLGALAASVSWLGALILVRHPMRGELQKLGQAFIRILRMS